MSNSDWIPSNARITSSVLTKKWNNGNKILTNVTINNPGTRNKNFENAVGANRNSGRQLGSASTYGTVIEIGGKFVKKKMIFKKNQADAYLKIFLNEIRVGSIPGIQKVGPKIYAWRIHRNSAGDATSGEYIMDNFNIVPEGYTSVPFDKYIRDVLGNRKTFRLKILENIFYKKFKYFLREFWRITKGYHGDLGIQNIAIVYNKSTRLVKKFIFFDYGSHKKFKTSTNNSTTFENFVNVINKEFKNRYSKTRGLNEENREKKGLKIRYYRDNVPASMYYYPSDSKIPVSYGKLGQPRRPNTAMLRAYTNNGVSQIPGKNMMSRMVPENYAKRLMDAVKLYRSLKTNKARKVAHERSFVKEENLKEALKKAGT
jgi:hypothetical protein